MVLLLLVTTAAVLQTAQGASILALCAVATHSHSLWCYRYMEALAEQGHQITVFGVDEPTIKVPNMKTFIATEVYDSLSSINVDDESSIWNNPNNKYLEILYSYYPWYTVSTNAALHSQALKNLINHFENITKPFDLIIHDYAGSDALLGLVPVFDNPTLLLATTFGSPQWMTFPAGNIFNPAYVPNMLVPNTYQSMTFYERFQNTMYYLFMEWYQQFKVEPFLNQLIKEVLGNHLPPISEITKRANIVIVNHHFALDGPWPMLPGVIGISGLHIADPQPLPKDIKDFMDGAEHGVILVSFGSNVRSGWLPKDFGKVIIEAFKQLPQRVLWKWDQTFSDIPPNMKISKWLPQGDMLAHSKMRLFVSHCGLLSTQEAIYRKVPVLALPVYLDQQGNAESLVRRNLAIKIDINTMTADVLRDAAQEILSNPKYKENMRRLGSLASDVPLTARQQAVFWTEYALRHQTPSLRAAGADLSWTQLLLLDVAAAIIVPTLVAVWLVKKLFMIIFKRVFSTSKSKTA